jgi:hypothetical protein
VEVDEHLLWRFDGSCDNQLYRLLGQGDEGAPAVCARYECSTCGPNLAARDAAAVRLARPEHCFVVTWNEGRLGDLAFLRLEQVWEILQPALRAAERTLRAKYAVWESVSVVELSGTGRPHVHVLQWGSTPHQDTLRKAYRDAGLGWSRFERVRFPLSIACYVLKVPLSTLAGGFGMADPVMRSHLRLNGGKTLQATTGFWRSRRDKQLDLEEARWQARAYFAAVYEWVDRHAGEHAPLLE